MRLLSHTEIKRMIFENKEQSIHMWRGTNTLVGSAGSAARLSVWIIHLPFINCGIWSKLNSLCFTSLFCKKGIIIEVTLYIPHASYMRLWRAFQTSLGLLLFYRTNCFIEALIILRESDYTIYVSLNSAKFIRLSYDFNIRNISVIEANSITG